MLTLGALVFYNLGGFVLLTYVFGSVLIMRKGTELKGGCVMRYRLACFDLDGTLLDTLAGLANALNAARKMNNLPPQTQDQIKGFIGNGVEKMIERSLSDNPGTYDEALKEKLLNDRLSYYAANCIEKTKPYNGITEMLSKLKSSGMLLAVVTNKDEVPTQILIDHFFPGTFDYVRGSQPRMYRKPDPKVVMRCLDSLDVKPEECVYIGDSEVDIKTAANSGIDLISCDWGYRSREELKEHGAGTICSDPADIWRLLQ